MGRSLVFLVILAAACASAGGEAPPCSSIMQILTPCMAYLSDRAWAPYGPCCNGVVYLTRTVLAWSDRVSVCNCMKSVAAAYPGVYLERASSLPRTCGVNLNIAISPSIDCDSLPPP